MIGRVGLHSENITCSVMMQSVDGDGSIFIIIIIIIIIITTVFTRVIHAIA
jgi:hypothetical protein